MANSKINFYVVELHNNEYYYKKFNYGTPKEEMERIINETPRDRIYCNVFYSNQNVPIIAVDSPDKTHLIEYFTHKPIFEKTESVMNGLSYTSKRDATVEELIRTATYSKDLKDNPEAMNYYIEIIEQIEQKSIKEYEKYIEALEELENIYNSPDLQIRR